MPHFFETQCILAGGWLAGEIWLKSAGLTTQLKLAFYDFFAGSRCSWWVGHQNFKKIYEEYCLLFVNKCKLYLYYSSDLTRPCIFSLFSYRKSPS